jgi:hypothetical protein
MIINSEIFGKELGRLFLNLGQIVFTVVIVGAIFNNESGTNLIIALAAMILSCLLGILFVSKVTRKKGGKNE